MRRTSNHYNIFSRMHYNYLALELPFILGLNEHEVSSMATSLDRHNQNFNYDRFMDAWRREVERRLEESDKVKINSFNM